MILYEICKKNDSKSFAFMVRTGLQYLFKYRKPKLFQWGAETHEQRRFPIVIA
jgi:hypothetical protein